MVKKTVRRIAITQNVFTLLGIPLIVWSVIEFINFLAYTENIMKKNDYENFVFYLLLTVLILYVGYYIFVYYFKSLESLDERIKKAIANEFGREYIKILYYSCPSNFTNKISFSLPEIGSEFYVKFIFNGQKLQIEIKDKMETIEIFTTDITLEDAKMLLKGNGYI